MGEVLMAQELRHELLNITVADGTTASNSAAEFRNDSASMAFIRGLDYAHTLSTAGPNEVGQAEISKSPTLQQETNNSPFFVWPQTLAANTDVALDSNMSINGSKRYGRGQLSLEPNESLFVNIFKSSGGSFAVRYVIEYEFGR